jgi:hypothetical protein
VRGRHDQPGSFTSTFSTNAHGFRGGPVAPEKAGRRVFVLGDSYAWGYGVDDDQTFAVQLDALLPDADVVNLGVTAYGLRQSITRLQHHWHLSPDVVVLALVLNDIYRPREERASGFSRTFRTPSTSVPSDRRRLADFAIYRLVQDVVRQYKPAVDLLVALGLKGPPEGFDVLDRHLMPALIDSPTEMASSWADTAADLAVLRYLCEARALDLDLPYRRLAELAADLGLAFTNPVPLFEAAPDASTVPSARYAFQPIRTSALRRSVGPVASLTRYWTNPMIEIPSANATTGYRVEPVPNAMCRFGRRFYRCPRCGHYCTCFDLPVESALLDWA